MKRIIHRCGLSLLGLVIFITCSDQGSDTQNQPVLVVDETVFATFSAQSDSGEITLSFTNEGDIDLLLWDWRLEPDTSGYRLSPEVLDTVRIPPGENAAVIVKIPALTLGTDSVTIYFSSNDPDFARHSIALIVTVTASPKSYANDVQPIFSSNCGGCHGSSGGLSLASYTALMAGNSDHGPVVIPGDGANSILVKKLKGTAGFGSPMPLGGSLSFSQITTIETWINEGALDN